MKIHCIVVLPMLFISGAAFASGIIEYKGQNYFMAPGSIVAAMEYSLSTGETEESFLDEHNVISDGKFFFIDYLSNHGIIEKFEKKGYIEYGDKIALKTLFSVFEVDERKIKRLKLECFYYGKKEYCGEGIKEDTMTIIGYTLKNKIILTEIYLTEKDTEKIMDEFKVIYSTPLWQ